MKKHTKLRLEKHKINNEHTVKSYKYGSNFEITTANGLHSNGIQVLPDKRYRILATGEIREMNTSARNRQDNLESVRHTMRKLRRLIACNFDGGTNQLWVTLTFQEHVTSTIEAYRAFDRFMKRMRRKFPYLLYISVIEPQASGRWHFHVLLKDTKNSVLYINNKDLSDIWGFGFVKVNRLKSGDNVSNYVMAYVSDLDYEVTDESKNTTKKIEKGARLYLYPKGLRIYRTSRNIKRPIEITAPKGELLEYYEIFQSPSYVKETVHITDKDTEIKYVTEYYNNL